MQENWATGSSRLINRVTGFNGLSMVLTGYNEDQLTGSRKQLILLFQTNCTQLWLLHFKDDVFICVNCHASYKLLKTEFAMSSET